MPSTNPPVLAISVAVPASLSMRYTWPASPPAQSVPSGPIATPSGWSSPEAITYRSEIDAIVRRYRGAHPPDRGNRLHRGCRRREPGAARAHRRRHRPIDRRGGHASGRRARGRPRGSARPRRPGPGGIGLRRGRPHCRHTGRGHGARRAGGGPRDPPCPGGLRRTLHLHERCLGVRERAARAAPGRGLAHRPRRDLRMATVAGVRGRRGGRGRRADGGHPPGDGLRPGRRPAEPVRGHGRRRRPSIRGRRGQPLDARPRRRPGRASTRWRSNACPPGRS